MHRNADDDPEIYILGKRTGSPHGQAAFCARPSSGKGVCRADGDLKSERLSTEYREAVGRRLEENILIEEAFFQRGQRFEQKAVFR